MKVAIVVPHLRIGGAQKQALALESGLREIGIDAQIVELEEAGRGRSAGVDKAVFGFGLRSRLLWKAISATKRLVRLSSRLLWKAISATKRLVRVAPRSRLLWKAISATPILRFHLFCQTRFRGRFIREKVVASLLLAVTGVIFPTSRALLRNSPTILELASSGFTMQDLALRPSLLVNLVVLRHRLIGLRPHLIVSFLTTTNIVSLLAAGDLRIPVIVCERNDVGRQPLRPEIRALREITYARAAVVTGNSMPTVRYLESLAFTNQVSFFPNRYDFAMLGEGYNQHQKKLVVVARLVPQKNIDMIIRAFIASEIRFLGWRLEIVGGGEMSGELERLAQATDGACALLGERENPWESVRPATFFVSASEFEGSQNSLHEGVANGLVPLVSQSVREFPEIVGAPLRNDLQFAHSERALTSKFLDLPRLYNSRAEIQREVALLFEQYWTDVNSVWTGEVGRWSREFNLQDSG